MTEHTNTVEHLSPAAVADYIHGDTPAERLEATERHLGSCDECAASLANAVRSLRPPTPEEKELLGGSSISPEDRAKTLIKLSEQTEPPAIQPFSRRELLTAAAAIVAGLGLSYVVYYRIFEGRLPGLVPPDPLRMLAEARLGTGQIPLRYVRTFDRAPIVRSPFDPEADIGPIIEAAEANVSRSASTENMLTLGLVLLDDKRLSEAESWLNRVREADPASVDALNGLAVLNYARAEIDPAQSYLHYQTGLALLRDAERVDREDLQVLYNYGMFYEALEMLDPAARAWRRYLSHDSSSPWAEEAAARLKLLEEPRN